MAAVAQIASTSSTGQAGGLGSSSHPSGGMDVDPSPGLGPAPGSDPRPPQLPTKVIAPPSGTPSIFAEEQLAREHIKLVDTAYSNDQLPSVPGIAFQLTRTKIGRALYQIDPVVSAVHTDILARLNTYAQQNRRSFLGVLPVTALLRLLRLVPSTQEETIRVWLREHHEETLSDFVQGLSDARPHCVLSDDWPELSKALFYCRAATIPAPLAVQLLNALANDLCSPSATMAVQEALIEQLRRIDPPPDNTEAKHERLKLSNVARDIFPQRLFVDIVGQDSEDKLRLSTLDTHLGIGFSHLSILNVGASSVQCVPILVDSIFRNLREQATSTLSLIGGEDVNGDVDPVVIQNALVHRDVLGTFFPDSVVTDVKVAVSRVQKRNSQPVPSGVEDRPPPTDIIDVVAQNLELEKQFRQGPPAGQSAEEWDQVRRQHVFETDGANCKKASTAIVHRNSLPRLRVFGIPTAQNPMEDPRFGGGDVDNNVIYCYCVSVSNAIYTVEHDYPQPKSQPEIGYNKEGIQEKGYRYAVFTYRTVNLEGKAVQAGFYVACRNDPTSGAASGFDKLRAGQGYLCFLGPGGPGGRSIRMDNAFFVKRHKSDDTSTVLAPLDQGNLPGNEGHLGFRIRMALIQDLGLNAVSVIFPDASHWCDPVPKTFPRGFYDFDQKAPTRKAVAPPPAAKPLTTSDVFGGAQDPRSRIRKSPPGNKGKGVVGKAATSGPAGRTKDLLPPHQATERSLVGQSARDPSPPPAKRALQGGSPQGSSSSQPKRAKKPRTAGSGPKPKPQAEEADVLMEDLQQTSKASGRDKPSNKPSGGARAQGAGGAGLRRQSTSSRASAAPAAASSSTLPGTTLASSTRKVRPSPKTPASGQKTKPTPESSAKAKRSSMADATQFDESDD